MRAAVVGYGSAGSRHAALLAARGLTVTVSDPDDGRQAGAAAAGFETRPLSDALADAELVIIASPNHLHREQLEQALAHGCDVLVEKPIATGVDGLERLLNDARRAGLIVGVGNNLRFVEAIERGREVIAAGRVGRVIRVRADFGFDLRAWRPTRDLHDAYSARPEQGGGILLDAIHEFDYLFWWFGEVRSVSCLAGSRSSLELEVEDVACAVLDFESDVFAEVALDYASGVYRRGFEVVGEEGVATWRWDAPSLLVETREGVDSIAVRPVADMYERLLDDFLAAVEQRCDPRTPGEQGVRVLEIVLAAVASNLASAVVHLRPAHAAGEER